MKTQIGAYLSSTQTDNKICNECILGFTTTMADHHTPTTTLSKFTSRQEHIKD